LGDFSALKAEITKLKTIGERKVSGYEDAMKQSKPCTLRKVNWFANDETGVMYVREWDERAGVWVNERAIVQLSRVAQLLDRLQVMPNT